MKEKLKISQTEEYAQAENFPSEASQMDISSYDENGNPIEQVKKEDKTLSAEESLCKKTTYSKEDLQMLIDAGFETELNTLAGVDEVKRYRAEKLLEKDEKSISIFKKGSRQDVKSILAHSKHKFIAFLILGFVVFELSTFCASPSFLGSLFPIPAIYQNFVSMALQTFLLLLGIAFSAPVFSNPLSCNRYFSKTVTRGYIALYLVGTIYSIAITILLFPIDGVAKDIPYLGIAPFIIFQFLVFSLTYFLRYNADCRSFELMNREGKKFIIHPQAPRKIKIIKNGHISRVRTEYSNNRFYRIDKAHRVTGLYDHPFPEEKPKGSSHFLLYFSLAFAFAFTFITSLIKYDTVSVDTLLNSIKTLLATFFTVFPTYFLFGVLFPYAHVNKLLHRKNSTFLGEDTISTFEKNKTIVFNDDELISVKKLNEISFVSGEEYSKAKFISNTLIKKIGGSLGKIYPKETGKVQVRIVKLTENGVDAYVDEHHCYFGNSAYIQSKNYELPTLNHPVLPAKNQVENYFVMDDMVCFYTLYEYTLKDYFGKAIKRVAQSGFRLAVYTFDPNLNYAFVNLLSTDAERISSTVKLPKLESRKSMLACTSGIASFDGSHGVFDCLFAIRNVIKTRKANFALSFMFTFLSAIAVVVSHLLDITAVESISSIVIFQMISFFAVFFMTKLLSDNDFADYTPEEKKTNEKDKKSEEKSEDNAEAPVLTLPQEEAQETSEAIEEPSQQENNKEEDSHAE